MMSAPLRPWLVTTTSGSATVMARGQAAAIRAGLELAQPADLSRPRATLLAVFPQEEW